MTNKLSTLPRNQFVALWNAAVTLDDVVTKVCELVGRVPRWAVLARAAACRKAGAEMKKFAPARNAE
ncbi:MAG TPA: hypothetical protein VKE74_07060 [Gemmataceae bacterium]|nr:hypothetical protein [Gemmataceae bacterium]